jgi:hypothetical protein
MRKLFLFFVVSFLFSSCKKEPFFSNFDIIEHYHLKNDPLLDEIPNDFVWQKIMYNDYPLSIEDKQFYEKISAKNFNKKLFSRKDIDTFKEMFISTTFTDFYTAACVPEYRDILILKKSDTIVGIVKICIGCKMHYIIGKNQNNKEVVNGGGIENPNLEILLDKNTNP